MWKYLAIASLILWGLTGILFFDPFLSHSSDIDKRTSVNLTSSEKNMVLTEMRQLLKGVQGIIKAVSEDNIKEVIIHARSNGMVMATEADHNPGLVARLPMNFKKLGFGVHNKFDDLADRAESMTGQEILKETSSIMNSCVACHATYKISTSSLGE